MPDSAFGAAHPLLRASQGVLDLPHTDLQAALALLGCRQFRLQTAGLAQRRGQARLALRVILRARPHRHSVLANKRQTRRFYRHQMRSAMLQVACLPWNNNTHVGHKQGMRQLIGCLLQNSNADTITGLPGVVCMPSEGGRRTTAVC